MFTSRKIIIATPTQYFSVVSRRRAQTVLSLIIANILWLIIKNVGNNNIIIYLLNSTSQTLALLVRVKNENVILSSV